MDVWGVFTGGARPIAKPFLVIHMLLTAAFVVACVPTCRPRAVRSGRWTVKASWFALLSRFEITVSIGVLGAIGLVRITRSLAPGRELLVYGVGPQT
jgi:hypothetical protein